MVVALWTAAGLAPGVLGYLVFQQWGPIALAAFWVIASRAAREPQVKGVAAWLLPLLLVPVLTRYPPNLILPVSFVAAQTVPRAAMAVLAWIGRPAAKAKLPNVSSLGAILSIAIALTVLVLVGSFGALVAVAAGLAVRIVLSFSYRYREGITASSLGWTRQLLEIAVLTIWPPGPSL